jgi:hypothetical protein
VDVAQPERSARTLRAIVHELRHEATVAASRASAAHVTAPKITAAPRDR